jgi:acetyl-CoA carboxylase biotin carboxyl carrier protein
VPRRDQLTYQDLLDIVELIKSSAQFSEFHLKVGDIEVDLRRRRDAGTAPRPAAELSLPPLQRSNGANDGGAMPVEPVDPAAPAARSPTESPQDWPQGSVVLRSPMVGTFYRAAGPGAPAFVEVGQDVSPDTTVCIIEVMKLMNSIPAGTGGVVTHILIEDAHAVEYGQPLIVLRPK